MAKVIVKHHVMDYSRWYPVYTEHGEVRRAHGGTGHSIEREVADPDSLLVVNEFATLDGARAFAEDPSLKDAMKRAGVDDTPMVWIVEEAETKQY